MFMFRFAFVLLITIVSFAAAADTNYVSIIGKDDNDSLLEQKDLKLEIEGKEVPIKEFFFVDTLHPKQKTLLHPAGRRQHIILLDLVFSKPDDIVKARTWMEDLASKASPYDLFALAGITQTNGLRWFCNLTSDRNQLRAGWNSISKDKPAGFMEGPEGNLYPANFKNSTSIPLLNENSFRKNLDGILVKSHSEKDQFIAVQGLIDVAYLLSTIQGRKNVYFITPGFDTKGLMVTLDLERKKKTTTESGTEKEPESLETITNTYRSIEELEAIASARPGPPKQMGAEIVPELFSGTDSHVNVLSFAPERNGFLDDLTSKTGGSYHLGNFDPAQVLNTDRFYYIAGWEDVATEKALCSIHFSSHNRKIETTGKWLAPKNHTDYSVEEKRAKIAEAIFKDYKKADPSHQFWADFYFEGGLNKVPMFVQISGDYLLRTKSDSRKLEIYNFVIDADQSIVDLQSSVIELDLKNKKLRERIENAGLKVWHVLLGSTKPMEVRWVILDDQSGEIFTHSEVLDVKENQMTMSRPFMPSTDMRWVIWPKPDETISHRGVDIRYPYTSANGFFFPDLSPQINLVEKNRVVYFRLYNLLPESTNPPVHFHLMDSQGNSSEITQFQLLQKPGMLQHQGIELFWIVNAFPNVQPGTYRFRVDVQDPAGKGEISAETAPLQMKNL
jgi:hypothetical protein